MMTATSPVSADARRASAERAAPHVCVCVPTHRRPALLRRLLESLTQQRGVTEGKFTLSVVIVDNDSTAESARSVVEDFRRAHPGLPIVYATESARNFALVRNRVVSLATGDFIAFIDDDEFPEPVWLLTLLETQTRFGADGVLGPVRPYFDAEPPRWIRRGRLCERPAHPTGLTLRWSQTRSGNALLKRSLFAADGDALAFDPAYAAGGEDVDFFKRATLAGRRFVWCEEAPAYEIVPPERWRVSYFLKRALLQGGISAGYACEKSTLLARARVSLRALAALAVYALILPFSILGGFHVTMKYLIKSCHHLGRLRALLAASGGSATSSLRRNF